ncbi:MAG: hypothetical protein WBA05_05880 [Gordonia sp. (in: high G+C Gram-positive bacteria)]|uniref:hypothetical protein n=1 Tax=Gordonia TaxID=2053 RepID=UPI00326402EC
MANLRQSIRGKLPSKRALLTVGGATALVAAGIVQTTGTMAAPTDGVSASVSKIASQNFFPTKLTSSVTCSTSGGTLTQKRANISWSAVAGATGYRLEIVRRSDGAVRQSYDVTGTSYNGISDSSRDGGLYARVRTMNSGAISSGYTVSNTGMSFKDWVSGRTECEGSTGTNLANQSWEDSSDWEPASIQMFGRAAPQPRMLMSDSGAPTSVAPPTEASPSSSAAPSSSEKPSSSASPESGTSSPSASESPSSSAAASPSESPSASTEAPAPTAEAKPDIKIAVKVTGTDRELIITVDGKEKCTLPLAAGDAPTVGSDSVTITNGDSLKTVDLDTCTAS